MGAAALSDDFRSLSHQPPPDPDIQTTLSDFLTYTEHFPSHLTRALALISDQRIRAEGKIKSVHDDATAWSLMPTLTSPRPDPVQLRRNISYALEAAERSSRMALEEAIRLDETCHREAKRLEIVTEKLKAQPLPPSRDPTPEQNALTSPNLKRERRLSTRGDEAKRESASRRLEDRAATKLRGRKIMVPGEVLPPPDPNAPPESVSEWSSPRASPPLEQPPSPETDRKTTTPRPRSRTPRVPRSDREKKPARPRPSRMPGQQGTNAHSAVAGISTSNALLALTKPPEDAPKGSKWLPWMKLTEWEMAKLRKRMKKNAIWVPSQTMVRRELKNLGRGAAGRDAAKKEAEETGCEFVDESNASDPTKVIISGAEAMAVDDAVPGQLYDAGEADDQDQELINRGMRLNEAKKLKRQRLQEEQALQAQIAREQGIDIGVGDSKLVQGSPDGKNSIKRKREPTPSTVNGTGAGAAGALEDHPGSPPTKMLRITVPPLPSTGTSTSKIPLAPAGVSSSPRPIGNRRIRASTPPATGRRQTLVLKRGKAVSEEPPTRRASLRRNSNVSLPNSSTLISPVQTSTAVSRTPTSTGRRGRRPAPGILTTGDADGAKVGVSKRKDAPRKKQVAIATPKNSASGGSAVPAPIPEEDEGDDDVGPDEPRYCLCGDVSWGTMIACDNDDCDKEWFHLSCVKLDGLPPRRTKWFCPDCRKKLKMGVGTNGLVGKTSVGAR